MIEENVKVDLSAQVVPATDSAPMFEAVYQGCYPFVPTSVSMGTDYDIDFNKHYLRVEVFFGEHVFIFGIDYDRDYALCWPHVVRLELAEEIFKRCKYRGTAVIPSNIILGGE